MKQNQVIYFIVTFSVAVIIFINFYCKFIVMESWKCSILHCVCIVFCSSNGLFIFVSTDCSLVKITSYFWNPNLALNLCGVVILQCIITLVGNSLCIKFLLDCFLVHLLVHIYVFYSLRNVTRKFL